MSGSRINIASKALLLFLQSLPAGSFYQIIGFGSGYKFYDEIPKEYEQKNIEKSIKIVEGLKGDMRELIYMVHWKRYMIQKIMMIFICQGIYFC